MKKFLELITIFTMLVLIASIIGCGNKVESRVTGNSVKTIQDNTQNNEEQNEFSHDEDDYPKTKVTTTISSNSDDNTKDDNSNVAITKTIDVKPRDPYCGDGKCDANENCDRCYSDCKCKSPAECHNAKCVTPECGSNSECDDGDDCTIDQCYFAMHPNAYCGSKPRTTCRNGDGCCPMDCNQDNDDDCEADCGNDICEDDEDSDSCPRDCDGVDTNEGPNEDDDPVGPRCGDNICQDDETHDDCPEDCCEPDSWYAGDADCNCMDGYSKEEIDDGFECIDN